MEYCSRHDRCVSNLWSSRVRLRENRHKSYREPGRTINRHFNARWSPHEGLHSSSVHLKRWLYIEKRGSLVSGRRHLHPRRTAEQADGVD